MNHHCDGPITANQLSRARRLIAIQVVLCSLAVAACSEDDPSGNGWGTGGVTATGGALATGGATASGGVSTGGSASGASGGTGGVSAGTGGTLTGGVGGIDQSGGTAGTGGTNDAPEWLPSWATSIQGLEDKADHQPPIALAGNTLRQFVWPTYSGEQVRIQLSNEKGEAPLEVAKVHLARAAIAGNPGNSNGQIDAATDGGFTFNGAAGVTIPAGQTVWSDALDFSLEKTQLTAISIQFGGQIPNEITNHPGSRTTSYFATGDGVSQASLSGPQTRDRWYVINALDVMAPADAFAIAVLGDSITDGYGVLNAFQRWPDYLTLAIGADQTLANKCSVLNFGMGGNNLTLSGADQDSGLVRFERDVLSRDKIKYLIVLEGVNDIKYSNVQAQPIIDAYKQIVNRAHDAGIVVYGSPITPMSEDNAVRNTVNTSVRNDGYFDAVIDLDAAVRDPNTPNNYAQNYYNDGLHPNAAGYEAMGNAVDLTLFH